METHHNIRHLREKLGLSQEALAHKVGYNDRSSIAKIEAGKVDLPQSKIAAFAKALFVTPAQLMGIDDPVQNSKESIVEIESSPDERQLTEGETALIQLFRQIPEDKQRIVIEMIRAALSTQL